MMRWALVMLLCMTRLGLATEPEVRVQARLVPDTPVMVGATLSLQVDLLVDTWFTDAPVLPSLQLPGAVVSPPNGEARHLNQRLDGKAFFGLRYSYQITPTTAQRFTIPALTFQLQPGQGSGAVTVQIQPLSFEAKAVGAVDDQPRLVASAVQLHQDIQYSHSPLRVGDSLTRRLHITAEGAQAMLIPPPHFAQVEGLKAYGLTPHVSPLSDGRGGTLGGQREDSITYVIGAPGRHRLPAIELHWWDATTGAEHRLSAPAVDLQAEAAVYQPPFSLSEDLRALGQGAQVRIASHWLGLLGLMLLASLAWGARGWLQAAWQGWRRWLARRRQAWLESSAHAWRQACQQCASEPARLDAMYLWLRRVTGLRTLSSIEHAQAKKTDTALLAFFEAIYGAEASTGMSRRDRRRQLQQLRKKVETGGITPRGTQGLNSLNP